MVDAIEKLLILQDRDQRIRRLKGQLAHIEPERQQFRAKVAEAQAALEHAKNTLRQLESNRKALELEVEGKQQLIARYASQQLLTRKNEEYRALAHEIETCRAEIVRVEDQELLIMEQAEAAQKELARATTAAQEQQRLTQEHLATLDAREQNLKDEFADLSASREALASAVDEAARARYERLVRSKGENVVVGVQHGVCGGCHMRLPAQVLVTCQAQQELVACTNCGRILYYTRDMNLAVAD